MSSLIGSGESPVRVPLRHVLASFALYFTAQTFSLWWSRSLGANAALWPATAIGLVVILAAPARSRWIVALTTLLANLAAHLAVPSALAGLVPSLAVRLLADWGGATVMARALGPHASLERSGPLLRFAVIFAGVVEPVIAAIGAIVISVEGGPSFPVSFVRWYVPDVVITLLLAPALWVGLTWLSRFRSTSWRALFERSAVFVGSITAVAVITIYPDVAGIRLPVSLAVVPVLVLVAYRYGVGLTAWSGVAMLVTMLAVTEAGYGQFAAASAPGYERNVNVALYAGVLGISCVLLAAVLSDLQASSERFQSFLNTTDSPILAVDMDRTVVGFSPAANRMFETQAGVGLVRGMDPLAPLQGTREVMARRAAGWRRALSGTSDVAVLEPSPDVRVEMRYEPMLDATGTVVGAVATATDLVQRERAEADRMRTARFEALGRLAGGVAHDVNNLMTIVMGQTYLLRPELRQTPTATAALDEIDSTVERTKRLTSQLLSFARAQLTAPQVVTLPAQVRSLERLLQRVVDERTELRLRHQGEPWHVSIDLGQFEQVVLNLALNARDAMPRGGRLDLVTDSTTLSATDAAALDLPAGEYVTLDVQDTGAGMPPSVLRHIFEPFYSTKGSQGTGLGLATVQAIVRQAGGAIVVRSTPGEGTTFRIWLPRTHSPLSQPAEAVVTPDRESMAAMLPSRIVVCEDEQAIRRIVVRTLESAGFLVYDAPTPASALEWLAGEGRDTQLLVSDVVMPGQSGVELMAAARTIVPGLRVLLMTGYADDVLQGLANDELPEGLLPKPFRGEELVAQVRAILAESRLAT